MADQGEASQGVGVADATETDIVPSDDAVVATAGHQEIVPHAWDEEHVHPAPRQYVLIAVVLCVLTAIEVGLYYLEGDISDALIIVLLWVLAAVKFFLVCAWYMHMRMDAPFFRRTFVVGIVLAMAVYGAVLLTFVNTLL
jgi:caa(3)-type oxidase subunit IV